MSKVALIGIAVVVIGAGIFYLQNNQDTVSNVALRTQQAIEQANNTSKTPNAPINDSPQMEIIAEGLDTPWGIGMLPSGQMLVTERKGTVRLITDGKLQENPVATISSAREIGEGGLLGIAIDPDFANNKYVYFYYTYSASGDNTLNRVVRMIYQNNQLSSEQTIVDAIPGASNHNGGRIKFGPDKLLYIATGDAQEPSRAQDKSFLAGKVLRVNAQGKVEVYSLGHRNIQGIAWDKDGNLWATEHGRSGALSGLDEINLIAQGSNYGWPDIQGNETRDGMQTPARNSGNTTWAPAGMAYLNGSLFYGGLRGQALYEAVVKGNKITEVKEHLKGELGRIREVIEIDGILYITTSNLDGRGSPKDGDDKVIKVNPSKL